MSEPKFNLGQIVATPAAIQLLEQAQASGFDLVRRHHSGDWGHCCEEDSQANQDAVQHGGRVFSVYEVGEDKVWVITEADRSVTTILLPSEY